MKSFCKYSFRANASTMSLKFFIRQLSSSRPEAATRTVKSPWATCCVALRRRAMGLAILPENAIPNSIKAIRKKRIEKKNRRMDMCCKL